MWREGPLPVSEHRRFFPGCYHRKTTRTAPPIGGHPQLRSYSGTAKVDRFGPAASVVLFDTQAVHRNLHIQGLVAAILDALRTLHDWVRDWRQDQSLLYNMTLSAGDYRSVRALECR